MDHASRQHVLDQLAVWRDQDEPLVEAIGDTLARYKRVDSQEFARRVVDAIISVLSREH